jgi:hypothetical protein
MEFDKIFNTNRSVFYKYNDQGIIQIRGRFIEEIKIEEYTDIICCILSGFKHKNLNEIVNLFPNLVTLYMEKTAQLLSLDGLHKLSSLKKLEIENCPKLKDVSALELCINLEKFYSTKFENNINLLSFLSKNSIVDLRINGQVADLDEISKFTNLDHVLLEGFDCSRESLPTLPKLKEGLSLWGFPNLKDASFLNNLDSSTAIGWSSGPKAIANIPEHITIEF